MRIIHDVWSFWAYTWKEDKILFCSEMIGTIGAMLGSLFFAISVGNIELMLYGFIVYFVSNVGMLYAMYVRKSAWILLMCLWFMGVNMLGIVKIVC